MSTMKVLALILFVVAGSQAHYTLMNLGTNAADFTTVRKPNNWASHSPVEDLTSPNMACNQLGTAQKTLTLAAGGQLPIDYSQAPYHPGPYQVYLAKVPAGESVSTWNPTGNVWFKIYSSGATLQNGQVSFPATWANPLNVKLPPSLPPGDYLVRPEHIGLHVPGKPQLYIGCGQLTVTGSGTGTPGPLVAFPGAYKLSDPGLALNLGSHPTTYTAPGPAVWTG